MQGYSSQQAAKVLEENGLNVLQEGKRKSTLEVFFSQFADLLVIILMVAAIISMASGNTESTLVIFAVILMFSFAISTAIELTDIFMRVRI